METFARASNDKIKLYDNGLRNPKIDYMRKGSYPINHFAETIKTAAKVLIHKAKSIIDKEKERWKNDITNYRILCFSEFNNSILLWERYAAEHTGVVFKWKPIAEIDSPLRLLQKSVNSRFCHGELVEPYNEINKLQIPFDRLRVTIGDFCKSLHYMQHAQ